MKYETLHGVKIPKIGFGTWRIGGRSALDPDLEELSLAALRSAVELGYTHFDTAEYYADGHAEELLGLVLQDLKVDRSKVFITSKVGPDHLAYQDVLKSCENSLRRLKMDTLDLYLIHWPNPKIKLEETFRALNQLVRDGKVKHLGVSNFKLKRLQQACQLSDSPLFTDQVPYCLPGREYVENGVLDYCQTQDVILTAYSPVAFRNINVNPVIRGIAEAHQATSFQVSLAWLVQQPRVITIPMSFNPVHQKENIEAVEIELLPEEIDQLNALYVRKTN